MSTPLKCKLGYGPIEVQNHFNNYYFVKPAVSSAAKNLYWTCENEDFHHFRSGMNIR
jgi:hypothetical protein